MVESMSEIKFIKGSTVKEKENNIEYKGIYSKDPYSNKGQESIKSTILDDYLKKYVVGFLNAAIEGKLFLGISDARKVEGIYLTAKTYDHIFARFSQKIREIDPPNVPESCCKIISHPLFDESLNEIADFYILEIQTSQILRQKFLYRTSNSGKFYFRNGASTEELKGTRLTDEIDYRNNQSLLQDLNKIDVELQNKPKSIKLREWKINILKHLGRTDECLQIQEELYKDQPNNNKVRKEYAASLEENEKLEQALVILGFEKPNPDDLKDPQWCTLVGILLRKEKRYREAINFFKLALKNDPKYRKASYEKNITYKVLYNQKYSS
ncbi:AlbA family DNA-binding domain-containing protein [Picosynechococcus sp. PCC 8807]|uniref:AlbA family DNA-binding domain-containing protein n=1 Tax=Picosynechococcus sp. PCC 8807 TaxID=195248 RepID=UPI0008106DC7|nr:ATP-binding protein [Picosynechococcus sp. PCC 8807]ANV90067.1 hypothetical protein AWQ24_05180 [Picosynechococcus sp. PCC 8807]